MPRKAFGTAANWDMNQAKPIDEKEIIRIALYKR
jgi:hypothetical protein